MLNELQCGFRRRRHIQELIFYHKTVNTESATGEEQNISGLMDLEKVFDRRKEK